ncbi:MAG: hypothetical protein AB1671_21165 [Thermodesulfobacteriota bacterium]|jgi:hypothetical protein
MWYLKKMWLDQAPGVEAVIIHYTCTPLGQLPDWTFPHETRVMEKNARVKQGFGGTTLAAEDQVATIPVTERPALAPPNARVKVLRMPAAVFDPRTASFTEHYLFHYFFEVWQHGRSWGTPPVAEEIVSKEIEYVDWRGNVSGLCAHWSVYDGDAFVYAPTETPEFIARFGEESPLRSHKFYGSANRNLFARLKWALVQQLPLPRRWRTKIWGPKGAPVLQGWHVGFVDQPTPPGEFPRGHEEWTGYTVHVL